jgi:hypothetical protein
VSIDVSIRVPDPGQVQQVEITDAKPFQAVVEVTVAGPDGTNPTLSLATRHVDSEPSQAITDTTLIADDVINGEVVRVYLCKFTITTSECPAEGEEYQLLVEGLSSTGDDEVQPCWFIRA